MSCDITLLILSFRCYKFLGWKGLTLSIPKNVKFFMGWEGLNLSSPPKLYHIKNRIKSTMPNGITGLERVKIPTSLMV
jgi:hypothetical protein